MKNRSKKLVMKGIIGSSLLLTMVNTLAHNIQYSHLHESVPLSLTSTIILGILLIFTALFILPRMEGRHIRTLATTTLLAGVIAAGVGGKLISDVIAAPSECTIDPNLNATGQCNNLTFGGTTVHNNSGSDIKVTYTDNGPHAISALESNNLQTVKIVKGPIQRSVVQAIMIPNCVALDTSGSFVIETGNSCYFDHNIFHQGDDD